MNWRILKYGLTYFVLVFGTGFILGVIRVTAVEPRLGTRYAELIEMPIMLFVIYLAAKYVVAKMKPVKTILPYLLMGICALVLLLTVEFTLVLGLQKMSIQQYLESRDGIAFSAYLSSLLIFALMPAFIMADRKQNDA